jgi:hypothetical protein
VAPSRVGRCGARLRHEAGQTVVIFAILLPLLLGLGAIGVDVGYWYVVGKSAQDAADAAALAAARELPACQSAQATAEEYVGRNMPGARAFPLPQCPGAGLVEVNVTYTARAFFGGLFGIRDRDIRRTAVAKKDDGGDNLAILSHNFHGCDDGFEVDAKRSQINGYVHSNGQYDVDSAPPPEHFWAADGAIWKENCVSNLEPDFVGAVYGTGPDFLPRDGDFLSWPAWFTPADFGWPTCSGAEFSGRVIVITQNQVAVTDPDFVVPHNGTVPPGTYCATESFLISGDGLRGSISALAPRIRVDGSGTLLSPFAHGVLFFSVPNADVISNDGSFASGGNPQCVPSEGHDLELNGEGHIWNGVVFNPCGSVIVNVSAGSGGPALTGAILASSVEVRADDFRMVGRVGFHGSVNLIR